MYEPLRTRRLILLPYPSESLRAAVENGFEASAAAYGLDLPGLDEKERRKLRDIYEAKLDLARKNPSAVLLCTSWQIILPRTPGAVEGGTIVGEIGGKGPPIQGAVEIGYGLRKEFRGQGFMTEAADALCRLIFTQKAHSVERIVALTRIRNRASQGVLRKNGFVLCGLGGFFLLRWEKTDRNIAAGPNYAEGAADI